MALAAVRRDGPRKHLVAVETDAGAGGPQVSLADRLAAAQAAVTEPRRRVSEIEAALQAAVERSDFAEAAELQEQLRPAREALALAEVDVRVITEAQAALDQERQAAQRAVQEAQQRARAEEMLQDAMAAEEQTLAAVDEGLAVMRGHLAAAKDAYQRAVAVEADVLRARQRQVEARRLLGEWPSHHPGPTVVGSQKCRVLADTDRLVRELAKWRP